MPKQLIFELLSLHDFRPADMGFLTSGGVVRAHPFAPRSGGYLMPVRALDHIAAGQRGRFVEVSPQPDVH